MPDLSVAPASSQPRQPRKIGILGGMGPLATADLHRKLILATPATRAQEHIPVVIDADPWIPDRTSALRGDGTDPPGVLVAGATRLPPALRERVPLAFLDTIAETATSRTADSSAARHVGSLATRGTIEAWLYHRACADRDIAVLTPDGGAQGELFDGAIAPVEARVPGIEPGERLAEAARCLVAAGVEVVLATRTEIALALTQAVVPVPPLDPTRIPAEMAVRAARAGPN